MEKEIKGFPKFDFMEPFWDFKAFFNIFYLGATISK